jgi:hypothetical protein
MESTKPLFKKKFFVPVYNVDLWIVVTDDVKRERTKMQKIFGSFGDKHEYDGLCSCCYDKFGVFFEKKKLETRSVNLIAHEVFHLTHFIIEYAGANFDEDNQEHGAILNGYLMDLVYGAISSYSKP